MPRQAMEGSLVIVMSSFTLVFDPLDVLELEVVNILK